MRHWFSLSTLVTVVLIGFMSCVKDKPHSGKSNEEHSQSAKLLVANEGAYGNGNASLSYIDLQSEVVRNNVYQEANAKPLGDVLQSIYAYKDKIYLVMNNSNKIIVLSKNNFKQVSEIAVSQP